MKVLLTNPINVMIADPVLFGNIQPIHLMYIASYLEKEGHEVKIFDTVIDRSKNNYIKILKNFNPDVVGIASVTPSIYSAWDTAEIVKKYTNAVVILGGDHVTFLPGESLYCCPYIDYIVRGEGEKITSELLKNLNDKRKLKKIRGLSYKKNGKIIHNPPHPLIKNLDSLPYPARHLIDMYKYVQMVGRSGLFVSSRGCNRGCSFCISSRKFNLCWRPRSPESVAEEMINLANNFPRLDNTPAIDDNFMMDIRRVKKICQILINEKYGMPWICQGRADTIRRGGLKLLNKMYKAGCIAIQIGVESPFKNRLRIINKGLTKNQSIDAVNLVKKAGMFVRATFLFGFENESIEKMKLTYDFAKNKIKAQTVQFAIMTPYPGTPYFEKIKNKLNTHDWRKFTVTHQFLDYDFDIEKEMSKMYLKYHLNPNFLKTARQLKVKQFTTILSLTYPLVKSIIGMKGNYLYDFSPNKWIEKDEKYWQKMILKKDLTYENTFNYNIPQIEKI